MSQMPDDELAEMLSRQLIELVRDCCADQGVSLAEAALAIATQIGCEGRDLMRPLRTVIAALVEQRRIEVVQDGNVVGIETARGPVRIRWRDAAAGVSLASPEQRLRHGWR